MDATQAGEYDPATHQLITFPRHERPPAPVRGSYDQLGATTVVLYFDDNAEQLVLVIGQEIFAFDDRLTIEWRLVGAQATDLRWHLKGDGEAELTVTSGERSATVRYQSGPSDEVPLALDFSALVEYEDFDFGLYLKNLIHSRGYVAYANSARRS